MRRNISRLRYQVTHPVRKLSIDEAEEIADAADLPDGAWMAMMEELSGCDAGEIADHLAKKHVKSRE